MTELALIARAKSHGQRVAYETQTATHSYNELVSQSFDMASMLLGDADDLQEARIAFLVPAGPSYTATQWGIWRAGGVAVPLSLSATPKELEYALSDSRAEAVVVNCETRARVEETCERFSIRVFNVDIGPCARREDTLPAVDATRRAMILYTSGTTSKPKGVVTTHQTIEAQIETLVDAWKWEANDRIPLFLPLHHIHGIINVMSCALWSGATIEPFANYSMEPILDRITANAYSVFMAVPTIYVKLIEKLESLTESQRSKVVAGFASMRLMVSGSAALPGSVHEHWTRLTGQVLLERYGMTEIGMALSNPYDGDRLPGKVGQPLPGVEVRLQAEDGTIVQDDGQPGEIQVRGPNVFTEYWDRVEATTESFDDGWFRSGDIAVREDNYYRIMGRQSVDIIKSGGYKLSALEIEAALLDHEAINECAVVGLPDATWGEAVAVAVVLREGDTLAIADLRGWCDGRVSKYKIPKHLLVVDELPRNAMGKVTKPAVLKLFQL